MNHSDIIVIGGGINGAAIARDAALRGLKVIVFEKKDFASGTTQYSTRLIHGGLRYLEQLQLRLVFQALQEREYLLHTAPHLVKPLQFLLPVYKQSKRPLWYMHLGMIMYDLLSFWKSMPGHKAYHQKVRTLEPGLQEMDLRGGMTYYDGQVTFPERLTMALITSAEKAGAKVYNYRRVTRLLQRDGAIKGVVVEEQGKEREYYAAVVINAAGPWVDEILGKEKLPQEIGGTKGSHIVVRPWIHAPERAIYVEARSDQRPIFIVPWRGYMLIGTTDIPYTQDLDAVRVTKKEVDYFLKEVNHYFPRAELKREDIIHCYAGVRPLPKVRKEAPGDIPRDHIIRDHAAQGYVGLYSIISGKITTHRRTAQDMVDLVVQRHGFKTKKCLTKTMPVDGGDFTEETRARALQAGKKVGLDEECMENLLTLFGTNYQPILALVEKKKEWGKRLSIYHPDIAAEVVYAVQQEHVKTLADFLQRRCGIGSGEGQGLDCVEKVAEICAQQLGWTKKQKEKAVQEYCQEVARHYHCGKR